MPPAAPPANSASTTRITVFDQGGKSGLMTWRVLRRIYKFLLVSVNSFVARVTVCDGLESATETRVSVGQFTGTRVVLALRFFAYGGELVYCRLSAMRAPRRSRPRSATAFSSSRSP